jgi:GDPmannose 4,6-dehydratase
VSKRALIAGITGQDGGYLSELLLSLGYEVWGVIRRSSNARGLQFIDRITNHRAILRYGDMTDPPSLSRILRECGPDEIYNLAAQSHVRISYDIPEYTSEVNAVGVVNMLEAVRDIVPKARFYQASTSEMFGSTPPPQDEQTKMHPRSPYGVSKLAAYWSAINMRESYGIFVSNGILFNHESERRGENFVTRKVTKAVARISLGMQESLVLGNLDSRRDWGYAADYVKAMHLILQAESPGEYVIATGETHSIRELLTIAFAEVGLEIQSNGKTGAEERYARTDDGREVVLIDSRFYRPAEVDLLCGNASKARRELGWSPTVSFHEMIKRMVAHDLEEAKQCKTAG